MTRAYIEALASAVTIALCIAVVIAFAAVGCMMNKRHAYTAHNVTGIHAAKPTIAKVEGGDL
jgi:hypothetical protein